MRPTAILTFLMMYGCGAPPPWSGDQHLSQLNGDGDSGQLPLLMSVAPNTPYLFVLQQSESGRPMTQRGVIARINVTTLEIVATSLPCGIGVADFVATQDGRTLALASSIDEGPVKYHSRSGRTVNLGFPPRQLLLFNFEDGRVATIPRQPDGPTFPEAVYAVTTVDGANLYLVAQGGGQRFGSGEYQDIRSLVPYFRRFDIRTMENVVVWPRKQMSREGVLSGHLGNLAGVILDVGNQATAEMSYDRTARDAPVYDDRGRLISGRTWWQIDLATGEFSVSPMTERLSSKLLVKGTGVGVAAMQVFNTTDARTAAYKIVVEQGALEETVWEAKGKYPADFHLLRHRKNTYLAMLFANHHLEIVKLGDRGGASKVDLDEHFHDGQSAAPCPRIR